MHSEVLSIDNPTRSDPRPLAPAAHNLFFYYGYTRMRTPAPPQRPRTLGKPFPHLCVFLTTGAIRQKNMRRPKSTTGRRISYPLEMPFDAGSEQPLEAPLNREERELLARLPTSFASSLTPLDERRIARLPITDWPPALRVRFMGEPTDHFTPAALLEAAEGDGDAIILRCDVGGFSYDGGKYANRAIVFSEASARLASNAAFRRASRGVDQRSLFAAAVSATLAVSFSPEKLAFWGEASWWPGEAIVLALLASERIEFDRRQVGVAIGRWISVRDDPSADAGTAAEVLSDFERLSLRFGWSLGFHHQPIPSV